jgi:DNA-binding MarR family transcriptional regulator
MDDEAGKRAIEVSEELRAVVSGLRRRMMLEGTTGDYTNAQVTVIGRLARSGPATVTALAAAESMRPQSMGAIIGALEAQGVVTGSPHHTDGRQTLWSLSAAALDEYNAGRAARTNWLYSAVNATLTADELDELARSLTALRRVLDN